MAGVYEQWFKSPGLGPNWMHDAVGDAYWGSVGKMFDEQMTRIKTGTRARFPDDAAAMGMADAMKLIGNDRILPRGAAVPGEDDEPLADWAARLKAAHATWETAGTARALLDELHVQGFPLETIIVNHLGRMYYIDGSGDMVVATTPNVCQNRNDINGHVPDPPLVGFTLGSRDQFYSLFAILFTVNVPTLGNEPGNKVKAILNQTVRRYRQGGARYVGAAVVPTGTMVLGWPVGQVVGQEDLVFGDTGARTIDPE